MVLKEKLRVLVGPTGVRLVRAGFADGWSHSHSYHKEQVRFPGSVHLPERIAEILMFLKT